jgi:16S rRNA (uracil1498-N3)-methyltransferase
VILPGLRPGEIATLPLPREASHHVLSVLRTPRGATLDLSSGDGVLGTGVLVDVAAGVAHVRIERAWRAPAPTRAVVVLGWARASLVDEALTLGTELGLTELRLVTAERSPPGSPRLDRLERVARAAAEQCGRAELPRIVAMESLEGAGAGLPGRRVLAEPGGGAVVVEGGDLAVAVGPEGGWTEREKESLGAMGFVAADLGPNILRVPTAVAAALARWISRS